MPNPHELDTASVAGPLSEIPPIEIPQSSIIYRASDLESIVEGPALLACRTFFDNNIRTIAASANRKDTDEAYIDIDFDSLSGENKAIALEHGRPVILAQTTGDPDPTPHVIKLAVGLEETDTPESISEKLQSVATLFKKQNLLWAPRYTIDDLKAMYGISPGETVPVEDFVQEGFYFDPQGQLFHLSSELYQKSLETVEQSPAADFNPPVSTHPELSPSAGQIFDDIVAQLKQENEKVNPVLMDKLDDARLIEGLTHASERSGVSIKEYIRHTNRFALLDRFGGLFDYSKQVTIPEGADNVHQDGRPRREERGRLLDIEFVKARGVDPSKVLFFRVTQPSSAPKPEYYWTSDYSEVESGLSFELGKQAETAVILVSTLEDINKNGGLIDDINDDQGIAVRQVGLGTYDQARALTVLPH